MWLINAFLSAFFAGVTAILAKIGIKNTDSHLATAIRTIVVLIFAWMMVFVVGSQQQISQISRRSLIFLLLSGLTTGGSWICYFKALQIGDVNKVVAIDKSSTILTMILAFLILGEAITGMKFIGMLGIGIGTYMMIEKKMITAEATKNHVWILYALASALLASLTSILGKIGIENVESNLGTAIRTIVVLLMAWVIVFTLKKHQEIKYIDKKSWIFIGLSGLTTGLSWLFYYKALQEGPASVVVPIDKLSILVTVFLAYILLKEKLSKKALGGLTLIVIGTLLLIR